MSDPVALALIAAIPTAIGAWNTHKLGKIHVLVNSRLTTALDEITQLKGVISRGADKKEP